MRWAWSQTLSPICVVFSPPVATLPTVGEAEAVPVLPDYSGACLASMVPSIFAAQRGEAPQWLPPAVAEADQVLLMVLDGLGHDQLLERADVAPCLSASLAGRVTSVAPTTTATALTSITTGMTPARHGVVGYRVAVGDGEVMNVLRWATPAGDARQRVPPKVFQPATAFEGRPIPALTKGEFANTGFTVAHLSGADMRGWRTPSTLRMRAQAALGEGHRFAYAYYDGIDKVAHEFGLGDLYEAELAFADRLVSEIGSSLPAGSAMVVVSDHGQVQVGDAVVHIPSGLCGSDVIYCSGEARFRWFHLRPGATDGFAKRLEEEYGDIAWVRTKAQMIEEGWLGGEPSETVSARLGDVALVPFAQLAFFDAADTGELTLVCRHGSLTSAEMWVPLCVITGG